MTSDMCCARSAGITQQMLLVLALGFVENVTHFRLLWARVEGEVQQGRDGDVIMKMISHGRTWASSGNIMTRLNGFRHGELKG